LAEQIAGSRDEIHGLADERPRSWSFRELAGQIAGSRDEIRGLADERPRSWSFRELGEQIVIPVMKPRFS